MQVKSKRNTITIDTVVNLVGNCQQNIQAVIFNLSTQQLIKSVLTILYRKIQKIRNERNYLKEALSQYKMQNRRILKERTQFQNQVNRLRIQCQRLQKQIDNIHIDQEYQNEKMQMAELSPLNNMYYQSCQLTQQNKQNYLNQQHYVSVFATNQNPGCSSSQCNNQMVQLMKKYSLTPQQFKQILLKYIEQQKIYMDKLQTDSQKELYIESKKIVNYDSWMKQKVKRQSTAKVQHKRIKTKSTHLLNEPLGEIININQIHY